MRRRTVILLATVLLASAICGGAYWLWASRLRQAAIDLVQNAPASANPDLNPVMAVLLRFSNLKWKQVADTVMSESSTGGGPATWSATRDQPGLLANEYLVAVKRPLDSGTFFIMRWVANLKEKSVSNLASDPFAADRLGLLLDFKDGHGMNLSVQVVDADWNDCKAVLGGHREDAWCLFIGGMAEPTRSPIIRLSTNVVVALQLENRIYYGTLRVKKRGDRIPLPSASEQQPWQPGDRKNFGLWSRAIPSVYTTANATAIGYLKIGSQGIDGPLSNSVYHVVNLPWPPWRGVHE